MSRYTQEVRVRFKGNPDLAKGYLPEARKYLGALDGQRQGIGRNATLSRKVVNADGVVFRVMFHGAQPFIEIDVSGVGGESALALFTGLVVWPRTAASTTGYSPTPQVVLRNANGGTVDEEWQSFFLNADVPDTDYDFSIRTYKAFFPQGLLRPNIVDAPGGIIDWRNHDETLSVSFTGQAQNRYAAGTLNDFVYHNGDVLLDISTRYEAINPETEVADYTYWGVIGAAITAGGSLRVAVLARTFVGTYQIEFLSGPIRAAQPDVNVKTTLAPRLAPMVAEDMELLGAVLAPWRSTNSASQPAMHWNQSGTECRCIVYYIDPDDGEYTDVLEVVANFEDPEEAAISTSTLYRISIESTTTRTYSSLRANLGDWWLFDNTSPIPYPTDYDTRLLVATLLAPDDQPDLLYLNATTEIVSAGSQPTAIIAVDYFNDAPVYAHVRLPTRNTDYTATCDITDDCAYSGDQDNYLVNWSGSFVSSSSYEETQLVDGIYCIHPEGTWLDLTFSEAWSETITRESTVIGEESRVHPAAESGSSSMTFTHTLDKTRSNHSLSVICLDLRYRNAVIIDQRTEITDNRGATYSGNSSFYAFTSTGETIGTGNETTDFTFRTRVYANGTLLHDVSATRETVVIPAASATDWIDELTFADYGFIGQVNNAADVGVTIDVNAPDDTYTVAPIVTSTSDAVNDLYFRADYVLPVPTYSGANHLVAYRGGYAFSLPWFEGNLDAQTFIERRHEISNADINALTGAFGPQASGADIPQLMDGFWFLSTSAIVVNKGSN